MKYKLYEVLGTAASGKSTVINALKLEDNNLKFEYHNKNLNLKFIKYFYLYFRIYYKSKSLKLLKLFIMFHIYLNDLKEEKLSLDSTYVFDQGPIYTICMLIYEVPSMEKLFLEELEKILPYYIDIIYLEAPLKSLCNRINNRKQDHRIKNKIDSEQKEFLNRHKMIYNNVLEYCISKGVRVTKIDTNANSIYEVKRKIDEIVQ